MKKTVMILLVVVVILAIPVFVSAQVGNRTNQTDYNTTLNQTNESEQMIINPPFISRSVYEKLNKNEWVNVGVFVDTNESLRIIINNLTQDEFQIEQIRKDYSYFFIGNISMKGLTVLAMHPNISKIIYNGIERGASENINNETNISHNILVNNAEMENQTENQSEAKPETAKPQSFFQRIINFLKSLFGLR